ncbi:MAG TPA: nuclear transport factor 2 family protein [Thermoleophilaceae bacterium]|nr:nuclear transport factor 2 family protein [Thermoleophilaceae bacterium]
MDTVEFVRDLTFKMCDRDFDLELVESTYADDFVHHGNGATTDKAGYLARGREYREQYASIDRPDFDELFAADDRVVVAYTLTLHRHDGSVERMAVMAIWTVADGMVTALREVDAPAA